MGNAQDIVDFFKILTAGGLTSDEAVRVIIAFYSAR